MMGIKAIEAFKEDLDKVKTPAMKKLAERVLEKVNDLNVTAPASSSGKYHPVADLGPGGLVRHSKMVANCVEILIRSIPTYDNDLDWDVMFLSGLLHDMCKYTEPKSPKEIFHTCFKHPTMMADLIREVIPEAIKAEGIEDKEILKAWARIGTNISSHMSRWNTSKYEEGELPLPTNMEQYIISFADLIAANKDLPDLMNKFREEAIAELAGRK